MSHETHRVDTPPPVNTGICNSFSAQAGAQVTFTGAQAGTYIEEIAGDAWPFCGPNGQPLGPPIGPFPLTGNTAIYVKSNLSVNNSYPYNVTQSCALETTKSVTIIPAAAIKKSA